MSRALTICCLFLPLVLILEGYAYVPSTVSDYAGSDGNETVTTTSRTSELGIETSTSVQEDQDPAESSETIVYNRFEDPPYDDENSDDEDDPEGPPDHVIPYSEHEEPKDVPTKPKYKAPGEWAKPARVRDGSQEDVPLKLLAQVRRTNTVRRLPQKKAIENAESDEERKNAARLREVVRNSKVNTVYTEEGYEDSAYDHAGHIRDADFHEGYARKLHDQMDLRKEAGDDDKREGNSAKLRKHKTIDPEEFKDYEDDYRDYHETTTEYQKMLEGNDDGGEWKKRYDPKVVAEEGIQKLQEDVEKEAEEIEKAQEIEQENLADSQKSNSYRQKKEKKRGKNKKKKVNDNVEESQSDQNDSVYVENYATTRVPDEENRITTERTIYRTTTLPEMLQNSPNNPLESYRYEVEGNPSPYGEIIDFQRADGSPMPVSYSHLFWDYFKALQNQLTTVQPLALEATTLSPSLVQAPSFLEYGFSPYPLYVEQTTPYPITESSILSPQKLVSAQSFANPEYLKSPAQNNQLTSVDKWQPISTKAPPTTDHSHLLETLNNYQAISLSDPVRNLASQESIQSFDNPFLSPLTSLMNRKPRYKITMRQKSKRPTDSLDTPKQESQPTNNTPSESPSVTLNDNYMKVLTHLRNEDNAKNLYSNALQSNFLSSNQDESKDLTRMRPPAPQKATEVGYQNFHLRKPVEDGSPQVQNYGRTMHRAPPPRGGSFPAPKQPQTRKRYSMPATDLMPPLASSASEYVRYKEANDYLTDGGNRLKQSRNALRPFRQASIGFEAIGRAKRRERRSAGREGRVVKVALANNGTSNRGETDQSAKNRRIERNWRRGTLGVEVGPVLNTGPVDEKKSRSSVIDGGKGSLGSLRRGSVEEGESSRGAGSKESLRKSGKRGSLRTKRKLRQRRSVYGGHSHEELLEEAPKVAEEVVSREIDARFNGNQTEEDAKGEKKVEVEVPDFDYVEELPEEDRFINVTTAEPTLDLKKYPFYKSEKLPSPSALRYAMDPRRIPRKTYGGMEFYNSRDAYKHCDEVEPKLDVLPKEEEPVADRGLNENLPRISGLGDKLDCFKAKYFDEDPFDNPLFLEKEVEEPEAPIQFDSKQFASRIMMFPKEDDDYVVQKTSKKPESYSRQRRPDSTSMRSQKSRVIRYKSYPRGVRPSRPVVYRVRSSKTRYVKTRRPQKIIRRPVTSASEMSSRFMPYQSQVYEDVMGTIKNMANSYMVYETTTVSSSEEAGVTDKGDKKEGKSNTTKNSTNREEKEKDSVPINIVEPNNNVDISIKGLMPPKYLNRHRMSQKRNRVLPNGTPWMPLIQKPVSNLRVANRRQKIRIYKRNAKDDDSSFEVSSIEKNIGKMKFFFDSEESGSKERIGDDFGDQASSTTEATNASLPDSTTLAPISKASVSKRKSKVPKIVSVNITSDTQEDPKKEPSEKVIYTIRDRIRHSKPKEEVRGTGKFVNETKIEENSKRKEPKYNYIRRRKPSIPTTTEEPSLNSISTISWIKSEVTNPNLEPNDQELTKENRRVQYVTNDTEVEQPSPSKDPENHFRKSSPEFSEDQTSNKTENTYAVHENVNESTTTTPEPPAIARLKTFLDGDPPGYTDISSEDLKSSYVPQSNNSKDFFANIESIDTKQSVEKEENDDASKSSQKSPFSDEESSEEAEKSAKIQTNTESTEETSTSSKGSDSEEDRTFFTYSSRPTSPAENYEDESYSDLGPRVNKPAFFHPPFSFSSYTRLQPKGSSEEYSKEVEGSEEKEEYVFPWYKDRKDDKKGRRDRYHSKSVGEYEYPWERRERLAEEERRRKEKKRKRLATSLEDEEDEDSFTKKYRRNTYPRGRYRFWTRMKENSSEEDASDNIESSSEPKPVKYSSRYNSKNTRLPLKEKSTSVRSRSVEDVSRTNMKTLGEDSKESPKEKKASGASKSRGASRGIVPEDVTLAPTRRNERKESLKASSVNSTKVSAGRNLLKSEVEKELRNLNILSNGTLDNSESRLLASKATNVTNSTSDVNGTSKKRRRPLKNVVPLVESTTKSVVDRSRRRQKPTVSTPDTITSISSTTPAPMVVRRKQPKSAKDLNKKPISKTQNQLLDSDKNKSDASVLKNNSKEKHDKKGSETIKNSSEFRDVELEKKSSSKEENLNGHNNSQKKIVKNDSAKIESNIKEKLGIDAKKTEETESERKKESSAKNEDETLDFKDVGDFDKSYTIPDDYDDEFGTVLKADIGIPPSRAVQLSEQGSREIMSSVSWISENYDF